MCNLKIGLGNVAASSIDGGAYLLCKDEVKRQGKQATMVLTNVQSIYLHLF